MAYAAEFRKIYAVASVIASIAERAEARLLFSRNVNNVAPKNAKSSCSGKREKSLSRDRYYYILHSVSVSSRDMYYRLCLYIAIHEERVISVKAARNGVCVLYYVLCAVF